MAKSNGNPRVVHLFDCADVGATLVRAARSQGQQWSYLPARDTAYDGADLLGRTNRLRGVAGWTARRWQLTLPADLLHIHFGTRVDIATRWPRRPFVVHFHGTDIREFYQDPRQRQRIQWGADNSQAVFYATPDLAEYALAARSDARYLPNPVDLAELPRWQPAPEPRIVFASRWGAAKGGTEQLELAAKLARAVQGTCIRLQGLDWGENAAKAAELGVELVPVMSKPAYLQWLAKAHTVVGQSTGLLGMSELQALAIGVPTASNVRPGLYPGTVPVVGTGSLGEQVDSIVAAAKDAREVSAGLGARAWVIEHHDPDRIVRELSAVYSSLSGSADGLKR
ncbi:glycosyltransferase [Arthrobacter sp. NPDC057009]|uniref:glycosyltransferase n=1 Tax=Arthrobacter sp. NPDC057009 TaxID=3345996 RepID=UPI0036306406